MALMVESGFPGWRAVAIAWLSRSIAGRRAAESSVIVRDTSVAVSMARSAMPDWVIDSGVSISTIPCLRNCDADSLPIDGGRHLRHPRERSFEQRVKGPLAIRDRRRGERRVAASHQKNAGPRIWFPWIVRRRPKSRRRPGMIISGEPKASFLPFAGHSRA